MGTRRKKAQRYVTDLIAALRYHSNGAFEDGCFFGVEFIGNRLSVRGSDPDGTEIEWFGTVGYDF